MAKDGPTEIYMIKKSAEGFIVSFRLGTDQGVTPGMDWWCSTRMVFRWDM